MTDEITQNDCQGERMHMYSAEIPINIELGSAGLYYGTSPQMKGLLVTGHTLREVMDRVPFAIAEMRAVAAMGPEIARLNEQLTEAREIIRDLESNICGIARELVKIVRADGDHVEARRIENGMVNPPEHSAVFRARAFLKGETDNDAN